VTVDLLVFAPSEHGPALLCIQRANPPFQSCWAFPGGFLDPDEDLADAAVRELKEETGVEIAPGDLIQLGAFGRPGRDPRGQTITVAFIALLAEMPQAIAGDDATRAIFWPVDGLLTGHTPITLAFDHEEILRCAISRVGDLDPQSVQARSDSGEA
jgi:8-oxo-dGTP diphosphatase